MEVDGLMKSLYEGEVWFRYPASVKGKGQERDKDSMKSLSRLVIRSVL